MAITTEELRKLVSAATPGPWLVFTSGDEWGCDTFVGTLTDTLFDVRPWKGPSWQDSNAALIAMAPTLAAELITARAKLEAAEKLAGVVDDYLCGILIKEDLRVELKAFDKAMDGDE
jgi:hypothetical protein